MVIQPQRYRFTAVEYDQMIEKGIFAPDARLELIDGEIVQMTPIGARHADFVRRLHHAFVHLDAAGLVVLDVQSPIRLGERYEPQPDVALLRPREGGYLRLPEPGDVLLVVEVADTTLDHDRRKAPIYADAGIPEYWLVDVRSEPATITVYRDAQPDGYHSIQVVRAGDPLAPLAFPELAIATEKLLG